MRSWIRWLQAVLGLSFLLPICGPILDGSYVARLPYHDHVYFGDTDGAHSHHEPGPGHGRQEDPLAGGVISIPATGDSHPNRLSAAHTLLNAAPGALLPRPEGAGRPLALPPLLAIHLFFADPPDKPPRS